MNEQSLKDKILRIAKERKIHPNECWKNLLLERFLVRLSRSSERKKVVFKGGFLLSYLIDIGRETTDLDFLLNNMESGAKDVKASIKRILSEKIEDGFIFSYEKMEILDQPHMEYPGYRITLKVTFGKMRDKILIDVGIGDVVVPEDRLISTFVYRGKPLFENGISLLVYPVETIFSEKLETVISKGSNNSRMKDYHDLFLLCKKKELIDKNLLKNSIDKTFLRRGTPFKEISFDSDGIHVLQGLWSAHRLNLGEVALELSLPAEINEVISEINLTLENLTQ